MGDLTIKEAAVLLGCSDDTVYRAMYAGHFPNSYRLLGTGPWRIPRADVETARERWKMASKSDVRQ